MKTPLLGGYRRVQQLGLDRKGFRLAGMARSVDHSTALELDKQVLRDGRLKSATLYHITREFKKT